MAKDSSETPIDLSFDHWRTAADLQLQLIDKLGTFQKSVAVAHLNEAQARYVDAQMENVRAQAVAKWYLVNQLGLDLKDLNKAKLRTEGMIKKLTTNAQLLKRFQNPERIRNEPALRNVWQSYDSFKEHAHPDVLTKIMATQVDTQARSKDDFMLVKEQPVPDDLPDGAMNLLQLIEWMRRHLYLARSGTPAYQLVITAMSWLGGVPATEIKAMRNFVAGLEETFVTIWRAPELIGLPTKPADVPKPIPTEGS